jgi:hypothetical protein
MTLTPRWGHTVEWRSSTRPAAPVAKSTTMTPALFWGALREPLSEM